VSEDEDSRECVQPMPSVAGHARDTRQDRRDAPFPIKGPPVQKELVTTSRVRYLFIERSYSVAHAEKRKGARVSGDNQGRFV
jgi:hypothetical protein